MGTLEKIKNNIRSWWKYNFILNSVERHRILYGKRWGWFFLSFIIIGVSIFLLWILGGDLSAEELLEAKDGNKNNTLIWGVISQFADPGNIHMAQKGWASVLAVICAFAGVVCLSGLLVSSLISFITQRSEAWRKGLISYNGYLSRLFFNDYVVVIGVNEQTATIVTSSLQRGAKYVLVQTRRDVEKARMRMNLKLDKDEEKRVVYYHGERTSSDDIETLRLKAAKEVYVLGEDMHYENEEDHDAFNMTCLEHISRYVKDNGVLAVDEGTGKNFIKRILCRFLHKEERTDQYQNGGKKGLRCHVNFEYQSTFMAFKATHIYRNLNDELIEFLPFNIHELWAKKILVDNSAIIPIGKHGENKIQRYLPIDSYFEETPTGRKKTPTYINEDSSQSVHLVVIGMNQMGVALAMQAALLTHLPNFTNRKRRTTITFIDYNAHKEAEFLMSRYSVLFELCRYRMILADDDNKRYSEKEIFEIWNPEDDKNWIDPIEGGRFAHIREDNKENFMDLQWEFIEGNVASNKIRSYLSALTADKENRTCTIAVCFNNPQQAIATALYLPETVLKKALQILVYQQNSMDMIHLVATSEKEWKRYEKLKPFGMIEGCYMGGTFDNVIAKFANLLYIEEGKKLMPESPMNDNWLYRAERLWDELGIVDKLANIDLVDSFPMKLRSLGIEPEDALGKVIPEEKMENMIDAEHRRWLVERLTMGYRPVTLEEKNDIRDKKTFRGKDFYKNKSRAHLNICPLSKVRDWDEETYHKNQDKKILDMMTTMLMWEQWALLRRAHTDRPNPVVKYIVSDMAKISSHHLWAARNTVSKGLWKIVMGSVPKEAENLKDSDPIVWVSKEDIDDFLLTLAKKTALKFKLPIIEEWKIANDASEKLKLHGMNGDVWQWTETKKGDSAFYFCGQSKSFQEKKWKDTESYWLSHFISGELGFRLFAAFSFTPEEVSTSQREYRLDDDYKHVIKELEDSMVSVQGCDSIEDFKILANPVSQRQWKAVWYMAQGKDKTIKPLRNNSKHRGDYYPVEFVSFEDAESFVKALRVCTGKNYRLPKDKEWIYAAQRFKCDEKMLWESGVARTTRKIVKIKKATPQEPNTEKNKDELYDMYGGVWEWCDDRYTAADDSQEEIGKKVRVLRGGSWRFSESDIKEEYKEFGSYWLSDYKADDVGFRVVISEEDFHKTT